MPVDHREAQVVLVLEVVEEVYARGFNFLPVDIYQSDDSLFLIQEDKGEKKLRPPLIGLPGLGETAAAAIKEDRKKGPYTSIEDIVERCGVNKNVVVILKDHGCLKDMPDSKQVSLF